MLANPANSKVVLINVLQQSSDLPANLVARLRKQLLLLAEGFKFFEQKPFVIGGLDEAAVEFTGLAATIKSDELHDQSFVSRIATADMTTLCIGGSWLEEEILLTAVEGVTLGYDVRVLADISLARREVDRAIAFDRMAQHGILPTTVGQLLLEWAIAHGDPEIKSKIRSLLS